MRIFILSLISILHIVGLCSSVSISLSGELIRRDADEIAVTDDDSGPKSTIHNGVEVPPMPILQGETFNDDVKSGYW